MKRMKFFLPALCAVGLVQICQAQNLPTHADRMLHGSVSEVRDAGAPDQLALVYPTGQLGLRIYAGEDDVDQGLGFLYTHAFSLADRYALMVSAGVVEWTVDVPGGRSFDFNAYPIGFGGEGYLVKGRTIAWTVGAGIVYTINDEPDADDPIHFSVDTHLRLRVGGNMSVNFGLGYQGELSSENETDTSLDSLWGSVALGYYF